MHKRTLVFGDSHGAYRALQQVLERSKYNPQEDLLIGLGDYVDGWSEAAKLVELLISIHKEAEIKPIYIRGNHDTWCYDWLMYGNRNRIWEEQGGRETINSYIIEGLSISEEHRVFFRTLHDYYIDDHNNGFCHGGYTSGHGLGHEPIQSNYYWDRDLWGLAMLHHVSADLFEGDTVTGKYSRYNKHKELFIGHTSTTNWLIKPQNPEYEFQKSGYVQVPMHRENVWNLDTGAGFDGVLTIMDIDTKQFWQSDKVKSLYPDEKGRG